MSKRPTYEELKKKLAEAEALIADLRGGEVDDIIQERDAALLGVRELEEAYIESEQNFRNAMDISPLGIRIVTEDGELLYANQAMLDICGSGGVEELKAIPRKQLYTPESYAEHQERKERRKRGEFLTGDYELNIRRPNGEVRNLQVLRREIAWGGERQFMSMYQDITERKRLENVVEKDREEYGLIVDSSPINIFYKDEKGKYVHVNKAHSKALNMPEKDFLGKTVFDLYSTDIAQSMTNDDNEVLTSGRPKLNIIEQYESASGLRWVQTDKIPIIDENGIAIGLVGFAQDITERKQAEEALLESEEFSSSLLENSPNPIIVVNTDTSIRYANPALGKLTGFSPEEVVGRKAPYPWWTQETLKKTNEDLKAAMREGAERLEELFQKKSGERFRVEITSTPVKTTSQFKYYMANWLDITERKRAEERIINLNRTLRSIRNVNQLITREKDRDKLIKGICNALVESHSFNNAWIALLDDSRRLLTFAEKSRGGDLSSMLELLERGEYPPCVQKALRKEKVVVTRNPQSTCLECPLYPAPADSCGLTVRLEHEGNTYGILCASTPKEMLSDEDERTLFDEVATDIAFALHDISLEGEYKLLEEERLRSAKLESISTLAGGIAHDFNNLLTGIMGNIGLAKTYEELPQNASKTLGEAEKAAIRARDLTQQLLTFARGGKPVKIIINMGKLIKESATFALRGSAVKLELSLPNDLWPVEADEGQINQVIQNIVINADEAMPSGGVLKITLANSVLKKMSALPLPKGNYIHIEMQDTGIGISKEHFQRIFEPYFTTKKKGSGLGLSTAYSIIKNHGGYITAESAQNRGTIFHIHLPASRKPARVKEEPKREHTAQAGGRILVMDDEGIIRSMLKNMLSLAGYEAELTSDGEEALKKYSQAMEAGKPFNIVIMDLTIPGGMGGKEAIKELKKIDPGVKAIVSSGYATDPIMSEYKKHGFSAVIAKPYSIKQLEETLRSLLKRNK